MNPATKEMNKDLILKDIIEQKNINIMKPRNVHDINKIMQNKYQSNKMNMSENLGLVYNKQIGDSKLISNNS